MAIQQADLGLIIKSQSEVSGTSFFTQSSDLNVFYQLVEELECLQQNLKQALILLVLYNQQDSINSYFFSLNNTDQLQLHTILQDLIQSYLIVVLLANIRSSIFKRKYYKVNSGFGVYEVMLYFISLFFILYSYELVSDILRTDPSYKSIKDVLQSFTEEQIAEDHYFTISNYYSCLKYSFSLQFWGSNSERENTQSCSTLSTSQGFPLQFSCLF